MEPALKAGCILRHSMAQLPEESCWCNQVMEGSSCSLDSFLQVLQRAN